MLRKINLLLIYRISFWFCLTVGTTFLVFTVLGATLSSVFKDKQLLLSMIFAIISLTFYAGSIMARTLVNEEKRFATQLKIENTYVLGKPSLFYNMDAFKIRVDKLSNRSFYANRKRYVIAFTPTTINISSSRSRDKTMIGVHSTIADFLNNVFDPSNKNGFDKRYSVYGFSRGVFLICIFTNDEEKVHQFINCISNECYRLVNEEKIKVWMQPFYGIKVMDSDTSIVSAIEDALIARDVSEKNYEAFTYFKDSFRNDAGTAFTEISKALDNNEFVPFYQPKYSLKEKRYVSAEALARWNSPEHGLVGPAKFIDNAEKAGLLNAIDARIFELAIKDISENLKRGRKILPVSVNFSLYEFFSRNFINFIMDTLKKYQVPTSLLEIEITETTSQVNKFLSLSVIKKIRSLGIRVLMDDFGAGYSQVDNLRQIPFDAIKIDKSYTDRVLTDEKTRSIFKYLVELGHVNNMEVIVEGAETKEQIDVLRKIKVDTIQGFYYSKPVSFEAYNEILKANPEPKGEKK